MNDLYRLRGLIPLLGGIYVFLLATGVLPRNPKNVEMMALWRRKFGLLIKILAPLLVVSGILQLAGIL